MGTRSKWPSMERLSAYAKEITAEIRRFAHGVRKAQSARPGMLSERDDAQQVKILTEAMQSVAAAFQELREVIPAGIFTNWGVESRLLGLMMIGQWLGADEDTEASQPTCALHGNAGTMAISGVIGFLGMHKKSGALKVESADEDFLVEFESGDVVHVESTNAPKGTRLGDYLVAQGAVGEQELERAIAKYQRARLTVGQIVSRENLVTNDQLRAALRQQMQVLVARMLTVPDARFRFEESSGRGSMERVRINVTQLLLETARVVDEAARDAATQAAVPSIRALDEAPSLTDVDARVPVFDDVLSWSKPAEAPAPAPQIRRGPSQFF